MNSIRLKKSLPLPPFFWKDKSNQLNKLKELEQKLGIKEPSDWYKVGVVDVQNSGGATLLQQYKSSVRMMVSSLYPEVQWDITKYSIIQDVI